MDSSAFQELYQQTLSTFRPEQRLTPGALKKALLISESRAKRFLQMLQEKGLAEAVDKHGACRLRLSTYASAPSGARDPATGAE